MMRQDVRRDSLAAVGDHEARAHPGSTRWSAGHHGDVSDSGHSLNLLQHLAVIRPDLIRALQTLFRAQSVETRGDDRCEFRDRCGQIPEAPER
jgi:hypothetical protein